MALFSSAARDHLIYLQKSKCSEQHLSLGSDLAWSAWPCRRGLLVGLVVVSRSSLTYLQELRVQLLLRERGEEMTFTQLSREQQETLMVPSSCHFPPPRIRHSRTVLTNCQGFCQDSAAANILAKYVDDSWWNGVCWFKWWTSHSVMDLRIPNQIVLSFIKQEAGRLCFNQLIASLGNWHPASEHSISQRPAR